MSERYSLETFILDIDRIISGEPVILPDQNCDQEYREMLQLAQLLANADYSTEPSISIQELLAKNREEGELEDDDLDWVAGGTNPDAELSQKKKQ